LSKRKKNILFSLTSLIAGGLLYVWFRKNTYIGGMLNGIGIVEIFREKYMFQVNDFFRFYLPDFLWGLSLGCGLIAIHNPRKKGVIICASYSFLCGIIWEILQHLEVLNGTGDVHDVIMYLLASVVCIIINLKETRRK